MKETEIKEFMETIHKAKGFLNLKALLSKGKRTYVYYFVKIRDYQRHKKMVQHAQQQGLKLVELRYRTLLKRSLLKAEDVRFIKARLKKAGLMFISDLPKEDPDETKN